MITPSIARQFIAGSLMLGAVAHLGCMTKKPEQDNLLELTMTESETRARLRKYVQVLAADIGGRSALRPESLLQSRNYIEGELKSFGYAPAHQEYETYGGTFYNIEAERNGGTKPEEIVVVGAHYDTAGGLPGANDNASGVAATLELARQFAHQHQARSIRWLFFANEEPPYFQGPGMGSYVYAKRCRDRHEKIKAMLSLETIGYYSETPGSQRYPIGFHPGYPDRGNFLGFVSNFRSARLLHQVVTSFRRGTPLPAQSAAAPASVPGIGWSDHWAFWEFGYRAIMVTDTAPYRYPYYHTAEDTPEKLDYGRIAQAVIGLAAAIREISSE